MNRLAYILLSAVGVAAVSVACQDRGDGAGADDASGPATDDGLDTDPDADSDSATDAGTDTGGDVDTGGDADTDGGSDSGGGGDTDGETDADVDAADVNGDGTLNVLVIGTNRSIKAGGEAFSPDLISAELQAILEADAAISVDVNVVAEDIYRTENVTSGIAGMFTEDLDYFGHSLVQYYYWPDGRAARMANLAGDGGVDWDYVVIGADPHIVSTLPGYYSLGVNKVAAKVAEGDAVPLLLMMWAEDGASVEHFEEATYRTADQASVTLEAVPAGLGWQALPDGLRDTGAAHPTPNGAYLAAASIYAHVFDRSASSSAYVYDGQLADIALATALEEASGSHYTGQHSFTSPFGSCGIGDADLVYNHGGTSTENGILGGLQWVVAEAGKTLQFGASPPIHFNYGRSSMGGSHLYSIDAARYDFSLGYPLQDDASTGAVSMMYGLDKRVSETDVETDLGVALHMVRQSELPTGRTVPIRTLAAQLQEGVPGVRLYSDGWHMSRDFNQAIGAYMYTLLTGDCAMEGDAEPADQTSAEWRSWMAHKIGYTTARNLMYLEGVTPCYGTP